jgi:hypothetical protein
MGQFIFKSNPNATSQTIAFGDPGDVPLSADFDGDGIIDYAIYRPSTRQFWWKRSSDSVLGSSTFGDTNDIPIVADFDGDGKTDISIYHPSTSRFWFINSVSGILGSIQVGKVGSIPAVGDIDGDGKTDAIVFDAKTSTFFWVTAQRRSSTYVPGISETSIPVVGNYKFATRSNLAVYDPKPGANRFVYLLADRKTQIETPFGINGDSPLVSDFDGDGKTDIAVSRVSNGNLLISYLPSATNTTIPIDVSMGSVENYSFAQPLGLSYYQPTWFGDLPDAVTLSTDAPQTIYQNGVPHTTKDGVIVTSLTSNSFLPLCLFHAVEGAWTGANGFADAVKGNFNCVHTDRPLGLNPFDMQESKALFDRLALYNLKAIIDIGASFSHTENLSASQIANIGQFSNAYKNHPSLLAWKAEDEPSPTPDPTEYSIRVNNFIKIHEAVKNQGDQHPVISVDVAKSLLWSLPEWAQWNIGNTTLPVDIASFDNYPIHTGNEVSLGVCNSGYQTLGIPDSISAVVSGNKEMKPVWFTLQANSFKADMPLTMPTSAQLRAQAFAALIHGATGLIYFAYDSFVTRNGNVVGIAPNSQVNKAAVLWQTAKSLNREINSHRLAILTNTSKRPYAVYTNNTVAPMTQCQPYEVTQQTPPYSGTPIRTILKESNGLYTLFAVNLDKRQINVKFDFSGSSALIDLRRIAADGSKYPIAQGLHSFSDTFDAWGVRIYQFKSSW